MKTNILTHGIQHRLIFLLLLLGIYVWKLLVL
jgi:hypothetical protein